MTPFYDASKSYEYNYERGPFGDFSSFPGTDLPKRAGVTFLGHHVDIPFGIPAGPLLNSAFVLAAWKWGFSINTYKTVRGTEYPCHPFPNVIKVQTKGDVRPGDTLIGDVRVDDIDVRTDGITNSFGVPSRDPLVWQKDVQKARVDMPKGNLLMLSFMGTKKEGMTQEQYIDDFAQTCTLAVSTGAPVLEVNFSCPNVGKEGLICNDIVASRSILEALKPVRGNCPLLVKIGYFGPHEQETFEKLLDSIHECADGVVAINTIQAKVTDRFGRQVLPGSPVRMTSGVCGVAIRWAGLQMAERIMAYKKKRGWKNFCVVGVGGVTSADDYVQYMKLGVSGVQSATGAMWDSRLALKIRKRIL